MSLYEFNFDDIRNHIIGTVEFVSPKEIKVLLDLSAPQNTAINTGVPTLFPKINGFVLMPNEGGALVGIISWIGIEYSSYPKRKGFKDFDLIDLPFPLRKMSVNPLGTLKQRSEKYEIERGVYSYPSVGDSVVIPTTEQLKAIVENKSSNAYIKIGTSPFAANAPVYVDPDKMFGRHIAVLGNTGSGKSCSVAGLIRWSLQAAKERRKEGKKTTNARFIILDPNGEYSKVFDTDTSKLATVRKFKVSFGDHSDGFKQLQVPVWMWNSYEWSAITLASGKTQRPLLRQALRELRNGSTEEIDNDIPVIRRYYSSCLILLKNDYKRGASAYKGKPGKNEFGRKLQSISNDAKNDSTKSFSEPTIGEKLLKLSKELEEIAKSKYVTFVNENHETIEYYNDFEKSEVEKVIKNIEYFLSDLGGTIIFEGPNEDSPVYFKGDDLPNHLEILAQEQYYQIHLDYLIMRIRTMLSDTRMSSVVGTENGITLTNWLEDYLGIKNMTNGEIVIIDLSIVPSDILHIVVSVISRIIFEALQRYRRKNNQVLPTVIVMEEAHNFISRYNSDNVELSPSRLCSQAFEKIAKEGRKFGLGLVLSSQRPSELSPTVLSQCNTFLLHRLVNDRDQELVKRFVPDNLGDILNELPVLPTKKAILLGWAAPIPILVDMNELKKEHRPDSKDPDFWKVWIGEEERKIDWKEIVLEWQNEGLGNQDIEGKPAEDEESSEE